MPGRVLFILGPFVPCNPMRTKRGMYASTKAGLLGFDIDAFDDGS